MAAGSEELGANVELGGCGVEKKLWIVAIAAACLAVITVFFPYSFLSAYTAVSFSSDLPSLQKYKMEVAALREENVSRETEDRVQYTTDFILDMYEMDVAAANRVKVGKGDLDEMLNDVQRLRDRLLEFAFEEKLNYEANKYLYAALRSCLSAEDEILWIKSHSYYSRFILIEHLKELQSDLRKSFEMYANFYDGHYHYVDEVE